MIIEIDIKNTGRFPSAISIDRDIRKVLTENLETAVIDELNGVPGCYHFETELVRVDIKSI